MTYPGRLSAQHTLKDWIEHPTGRPLIEDILARSGQTQDTLGPALYLSLHRLLAMSGGLLSQDMVDGLLEAANRDLPKDGDATPARMADVSPGHGLILADIQIRDPFLVWEEAEARYYLFGSTDPNIWDGPGIGFNTYRSRDLQSWDGPYPAFRPPEGFWSPGQYWAPEVHRYRDGWFMFATFCGQDGRRGTQVLRAQSLMGPFTPWSDGPVTPRRWQCLDGTLVIDEGWPWLVFCQEFTQVHDGGMWAQRLTADLRAPDGPPVFLFNASEALWSIPQADPSKQFPIHVTDGPFLHRLESGHLVMVWSSFGAEGYAMGLAHSTTGHVAGPWEQDPDPLWPADGGHGMIVRLKDGTLALTLHQPNDTPNERAVIRPLEEQRATLVLGPAGPA